MMLLITIYRTAPARYVGFSSRKLAVVFQPPTSTAPYILLYYMAHMMFGI